MSISYNTFQIIHKFIIYHHHRICMMSVNSLRMTSKGIIMVSNGEIWVNLNCPQTSSTGEMAIIG